MYTLWWGHSAHSPPSFRPSDRAGQRRADMPPVHHRCWG